MRMLHTSDWHLGRSFGQIALLDDQARFCDWLVDTAIGEQIDLVVVAGDVYDRAVPPIDAIALFRSTVARLAAAGIKVVAIAGNHDSSERLSAADGLTDAAGVFIRGGYARASDTITLELADGPLDVVAVPYLDPLLAPSPLNGRDQRSHPAPNSGASPTAAATAGSNRRHERPHQAPTRVTSRHAVAESTSRQLELFPASTADSSTPAPHPDPAPGAAPRLPETDHRGSRPASPPDGEADATIADATEPADDAANTDEPTAGTANAAELADDAGSAPERPTHQSVLAAALRAAPRRAPRAIAVVHAFVAGGVESESERTLAVGGSDRVTAGTLHDFSYVALGHLHTPQVLNRESRRYSGSPLPYSFSETTPKQVVVADLDPDGTAHVTPIAVPVGRPVAVIHGEIDELLRSSAHTGVEQHFVRAVLTDTEHVLDAKLRLQRRFPYVTEIVLAPPARQVSNATGPQRAALDPLDAALAFWVDVNGRPAAAAERTEVAGVIADAVREVRRRNEAGLRA